MFARPLEHTMDRAQVALAPDPLLPPSAGPSERTAAHRPGDASSAQLRGLPTVPLRLEDTGLPLTFLVELTAKAMFQLGLTRLTELGTRLCLSTAVVDEVCRFMRRESLLEVSRRGEQEADVEFELTQSGRSRAAEWLARNSYVGPAPVTLQAYTERVSAQSITHQTVTRGQLLAAFAGLVVPLPLIDLLGTAVNSGRPMLLYGPAGSGKTYLAEKLHRLLTGNVAIPHAICVQGEVIRVFDSQCHRPVTEAPRPRAALDGRLRPDPRWILCERPCIVSGGELTLEMLDLSFDARAGYYEAPPHLKANNGLFIVDDLGRQIISPHALMNRWMVPMERRHDHLMLRGGGKFTVPFDMTLVFSSNLGPADLEDTAFLRRLGHKIEIGALSPDDYALVFEGACAAEGMRPDPTAFWHLLRHLHPTHAKPLLACYPRDLLHLVASRARFTGGPLELSSAGLDWAWDAYFGHDAPIVSAPATRRLS